jgi:hypothetical protein
MSGYPLDRIVSFGCAAVVAMHMYVLRTYINDLSLELQPIKLLLPTVRPTVLLSTGAVSPRQAPRSSRVG